MAAKYFGSNLLRPHYQFNILLKDSFEDALQSVREGESRLGVVPAAYNNLFRLHCDYRDLDIYKAFPLATKEIVLARVPGKGTIRKVACHPSTETLLPEGVERLSISSKPLCVKAVVNGEADACIGSIDVVEENCLEIVNSFGKIPMTWEVFRKFKRR